MSTKVTNTLKTVLGRLLEASVDSDVNDRYYMALGRNNEWDPSDTPPQIADSDISSFAFQRKTRHGLQSYKIISGSSFVVPRYEWTSGTNYARYDDALDPQTTTHYVINSNDEVFLCLENGDSANVNKPSGIEPSVAGAISKGLVPSSISAANSFAITSFEDSDRYVWRYMYTLSPNDENNFGTASFLPVKKVITATIPEDSDHLEIQDRSSAGEIVGIIVDSGGSGYGSVPSVTITGNGSGASFTARVVGGSVVAVEVDSDGSQNLSHGSGYDYASITLGGSPTTGASVRAVIAPRQGIAGDAVETLRANKFMLQTEFQDDEIGTILAENDFRQVSIIRNPEVYGDFGDSAYTAPSANGLKILRLQGGGTTFVEDTIFQDQSTGAQAIAVFDSAGTGLYFYQNDETGFGNFGLNNTVTSTSGAGNGTGVVAASGDVFVEPDIDNYSGDMLMILNTTDISRTSIQTEDVKLIISF